MCMAHFGVRCFFMATTTIAVGFSAIAGSCKSQDTSSIEISYIRGCIHSSKGSHLHGWV